jgi:DNA-binding MarR family transcriptional regulator
MIKIKNKEIKYTDFANKKEIGKLLASQNKRKILYNLSVPRTPKGLSKLTSLNFPTVSKNIKDLEDLKLLVIENKELKRGKIVRITNKGKKVVYELDKIIPKENKD